ncbi:MAG: transketolase [Taibaiella sp.]|nr:transketolase [Taibaiella sp.]
MRKHFSEYIENNLADREDFIFITGDLGYAALEKVALKMGGRFINAGVAEQNMIGMAAGMASQGYQVICYSIAPFVVYRCLEQMRNDVCFHNLPVYVVGNGGGYGYGIMGSSHHAIEDIATLSGLPNIECFVPAFTDDLFTCLDAITTRRRPAYLRLGLGKPMPAGMYKTDYGAAMPASEKAKLTVVVQAPVANNVIAAIGADGYQKQIDLFVINRMPLKMLSEAVKESVAATGRVLTVEEHVSTGGLGAALALLILEAALPVGQFKSLRAEGYPDALYGSQAFHQQQSGLDEANITSVIARLLSF